MLRVERKITQQELVGDYITRNMLSQIENDVASPSIKTLEYIADRLGVPMSYLMQTDHDGDYGTQYESHDSIDFRAKKMFLTGDYDKFIETAENNPEILDEFEEEKIFLGFAYLERAEKYFMSGNTTACVKCCDKMLKINFKCGKFAAAKLKNIAKLYKKLCDSENSDAYNFIQSVLDDNCMCKYNIISAKKALSENDTNCAIEYLKKAELLVKNNTDHPYLIEIYKALEDCYIALEDYKSAHFYSSALLKLYAGKQDD